MTDLDGHICSDCGVYFTTEPDVFAWLCEKCRPAPDPDKPVTITTERVLVGIDLARGDDQTAVVAGTVNDAGVVMIDQIEIIGPVTATEVEKSIRRHNLRIARMFAIPPKMLRSKDTRRKILADIMRAKKD